MNNELLEQKARKIHNRIAKNTTINPIEIYFRLLKKYNNTNKWY